MTKYEKYDIIIIGLKPKRTFSLAIAVWLGNLSFKGVNYVVIRDKVAKRFWSKVRKLGDDADACWEWQGTRNKSGYGVYRIDGKDQRTHRVAWALTYGGVPDGDFVCHACDNPPCVRPTHLFLGTAKDNMRDAASKRRALDKDEKLADDATLKAWEDHVVELYQSGTAAVAIASRFDVQVVAVYRLLSRMGALRYRH